MNAKRGIIVLGLLSAASMPTWAQQIKGVVIDQKSKETLIGAVVTVDGTNVKAITMQSLSTFSSKCSLSMALFLSRER